MLRFVTLLLKLSTVLAMRCYVCGNLETQETCDDFDTNANAFQAECPKRSVSCGLHIQGNVTVRSCERDRTTDCRELNKIMYCYCTQNLCNSKSIMITFEDDFAPKKKIPVNKTKNIKGGGMKIHREIKKMHSLANIMPFNAYSAFLAICLLLIF